MPATTRALGSYLVGSVTLAAGVVAVVFFIAMFGSLGQVQEPGGCTGPCPTEPMSSTPPVDGLTGFGAQLAVWDYHHPLQDSGRWYPDSDWANYLPARVSDRSRFAWSINQVGPGMRVNSLDAIFPQIVATPEVLRLVRPELPLDARQLPTPDATGCALSRVFVSARLQQLMGRVLIRIDMEPDMSDGYTDRYTDAVVRVVPSGDPCRLIAS